MSINLGKRCKHWDRTSNPDAYEPSDPQSQIITGSKGKKKKRKVSKLDIMYVSSSNMEETLKRKKQKSKTQDTKSAHHISKKRNTGELGGQEMSMKKKRKKEYHHETEDITVNDASTSIVLYQDNKEKVKKSHKAKATKRLHRGEHFIEETPCRELTDLEGRSEKKKAKKDNGERLLDNSLLEESLTTDSQHANKRNTKQKGEGETFNEKHFFQRKSPNCSETPKQVDIGLDQSETAIKKNKKKIKHIPHQEADGITADDVASNAVLYQEQKEKFQISHKAKDPKRLSRDEGLPEESIYRELAYVNDRISLKKKKKKHCVLEYSLVEGSLTTEALHIGKKKTKWKDGGKKSQRQHGFTEELVTKRKHHGGSETTQQVGEGEDQAADTLVEELLIYDSQPTKKTKKWKGGGGLQDDGSTEEISSHRNSPDGSDAPEQVDGCLGQVEKPKKKKRRKDQSHQEAEDIAVDDASSSVCLRGDEPSYNELYNTEDRPSPKKKKSKKDHLECPIEDSLVEELLNYNDQRTSKKKKAKLKGRDKSHRQHGFTETTEQVVETVDQAEVHVEKKKAKTKKHLDRSEETSDILAEETQTEVDQSLQSRAVESGENMEGDVEDTEQISTSGRSRPQTCAFSDTDQNQTTESEEVQSEGDKRPATSGKNTEKGVVKRKYKRPSIREQDLALLEEYIPNLNSLSNNLVQKLINQDLERIRTAKQKGY